MLNILSGFRGLGVACWPLVPKFAAEAVGFLGRKKILSTSFGGEVKPSVPCRRFKACKRSLNLRGSRNLGKITGQLLAHSSTFRCYDLSRRCGHTGTWRRKWERLKARKSNSKLAPRTCPGCSVPEPYRSVDWALVPASPASKGLNTN